MAPVTNHRTTSWAQKDYKREENMFLNIKEMPARNIL